MYVYVCVCMCMYMYMRARVCRWTSSHMRMCLYEQLYVRVCVYACGQVLRQGLSGKDPPGVELQNATGTANHRTNIKGFRGFDSSIILSLRGRILMYIGDFPESLSQAILVWIMLVGRLGVPKIPESRLRTKALNIVFQTSRDHLLI